MRNKIASEPLAAIDYVAVVNMQNLEPLNFIEEEQVLIAVAVNFGAVRLIDNACLNR